MSKHGQYDGPSRSGQPAAEMRLPILLAHLSKDALQALAIALGEALRIGRFWLGVEFLLMGLSKQEGGPLPELLDKIGLDAARLRGAWRGLADVRNKEWRRQREVEALGAAA